MMPKAKRLNSMKAVIDACSVNEGYARVLATAFLSFLNPTIEEIADIKTAVSEAVTNCIVHAYKNEKDEKRRKIYIEASYYEGGKFIISIKDKGCGIEDISAAMQPLFTTDAANERSGMGFPIMQSFTDKLTVRSNPGKGTKVTMEKIISQQDT